MKIDKRKNLLERENICQEKLLTLSVQKWQPAHMTHMIILHATGI